MSSLFDLNRLPSSVQNPPSSEDFLQAEFSEKILNHHLKHAEVERFLKDTKLRSRLVIIFSIIIFLWLASVISILYFNNYKLNLKLSDTVLVTLITTTTVNVIGMMLIILRNLFPSIKK